MGSVLNKGEAFRVTIAVKKLFVYLLLFLGMFLFGSATPLSKLIGKEFSVFFAGASRLLLAFIFFLPFIRWSVFSKFTGKDWLLMIGIGVIGVTGFTLFMLYGMKNTSGVGGSIVMSCAPAITAGLSVLFFGDRMGWRKIVAIGLGVAGVLVLNLAGKDSSGSDNAWLGILLIGLAVLCDAAYTLFGKAITSDFRPVDIAGISALFGFIAFLPGLFMKDFWPEWSQINTTDWIYLAVYGVLTMGVGSLAWYAGVKQVSGSTAAGFMVIMPLSALLLSYVLLGEKFEWWHLPGFGLVFVGVLLIVWEHARMAKKQD